MGGINNLVFMTSGNWGLRANYVSMPREVVLKVWSLDQEHQHHLKTCQKCKSLGSRPRPTESEILGMGPRNLHFNK